jgi:hypothetical protein
MPPAAHSAQDFEVEATNRTYGTHLSREPSSVSSTPFSSVDADSAVVRPRRAT